MSFDKLSDNILVWAQERKILYSANAPKQMLKVLEEVGETAGALLKNNEQGIKDGIGDSFVTLIILSKQLGPPPIERALKTDILVTILTAYHYNLMSSIRPPTEASIGRLG